MTHGSGVKRLPGTGCRYYNRGRCLYEERLNPGYHEAWRCRVLTAWERAFDDFVDRAEAFDLGQDRAADLWRLRMRRLGPDGCEAFVPAGQRAPVSVVPCAHAQEDLCLLALPECGGRCRRYEPEPQTPDTGDTE